MSLFGKVRCIKNYTIYNLLDNLAGTHKYYIMKKIGFTFIGICLLTLSGLAQITVTDADFAAPGTEIYIFEDTLVNGLTVPSGSATAQTWDYSSLAYDFFDTLLFEDPANTPNGSSFPGATHAIDEGGIYTYLQLTPSSLALDGLDGDVLGQGVSASFNLNPNLELLALPATYGDNFVSSATVDSTVAGSAVGQQFDSIRFTRRFVRTTEIDAFGTLTTPAGSFNTIRVYTKEVSFDTLEVQIFGQWQTIEELEDSVFTYQFLTNNQDFYVLEVETDAPNGNIISASYKSGDDLIGATQTSAAICHGEANGGASAFGFGGSGAYTYAFSSGTANGNAVTGLAAGTYSVTISDGQTSAIDTFTVTEPDPLTLNANMDPEDPGMTNGNITLTASGGTPGYNFQWSNGGSTSILNNIPAGTYEVTVTDANGCQHDETFNLGTTSIEFLESASVLVYPNPTQGNISVLSNHAPIEKIEVYSVQGTLILNHRGSSQNTLEIELPSEKGIYFLNIHTPEGILTKKIIKQ